MDVDWIDKGKGRGKGRGKGKGKDKGKGGKDGEGWKLFKGGNQNWTNPWNNGYNPWNTGSKKDGGKGKGKGKGKEKGKGKSPAFEGYCDGCGKYGHKKMNCWAGQGYRPGGKDKMDVG
jgi:hypothetical protein